MFPFPITFGSSSNQTKGTFVCSVPPRPAAAMASETYDTAEFTKSQMALNHLVVQPYLESCWGWRVCFWRRDTASISDGGGGEKKKKEERELVMRFAWQRGEVSAQAAAVLRSSSVDSADSSEFADLKTTLIFHVQDELPSVRGCEVGGRRRRKRSLTDQQPAARTG